MFTITQTHYSFRNQNNEKKKVHDGPGELTIELCVDFLLLEVKQISRSLTGQILESFIEVYFLNLGQWFRRR